MGEKVTLHFFCGKMAAGKTVLAKRLSEEHQSILLVEDIWLSQLYKEDIVNISDYIKYSIRLKSILSEHIKSLLTIGVSVILDFPGNTVTQRDWFRNIYEQVNVSHVLHFVDTSNNICKQQLKERSKDKPLGAAFTSDEEFEEITKYFEAPSDSEGFNVVRYERIDA